MHPPDSLVLTLTCDGEVRSGAGAVLALRVGNPTAREARVALFASGGWAFEPVVRGAGGREVWRRGPGLLAGTADELVLEPGGHADFAAAWDLRDGEGRPVAPGEYRVSGRLLGEDGTPLGEAEAVHPLRVLP
ncbi:MAG: BsuPI-related putative proteinase inhibitor [Longimicrobiaceae bacterium]